MESNTQLWEEVDSIVRDEGLLLYDIEQRGPTSIVVFVANDGSTSTNGGVQAGVTSDDCSRVCKRLVHFFAADGASLGVGDDPSVEVSSPGINRLLRLPCHFSEAIGADVKVVLEANGVDDGGVLQGRLSSFHDDTLVIEAETEQAIPLARVKRANIDFKFE